MKTSGFVHDAIVSLVDRSLQLIRRVQMEPEFTLAGGILGFETMARVVRDRLKHQVNVLSGNLVQCTAAFGAALLALYRPLKLSQEGRLPERHDEQPRTSCRGSENQRN